ncbi:proline-rich protein 15 [Ochotona curzoniae]|uniref:proline-rich protein 15 n=1 Tax=Ochotona curzoniae TaxID=130825 RepID=UPI001B3497AC|nr:proline-rich protein 15 [Ochotona curzoniae]
MADGTGGGTGSSSSWWKSLTNSSKKKNKAAAVGAQPPTQPTPGEPTQPSPDWTNSARENQHPNVLGGSGEPPKSDKDGEKSGGGSRRNLKVSRSGRFKEKRKVRATLLPDGMGSPEEVNLARDPQENA